MKKILLLLLAFLTMLSVQGQTTSTALKAQIDTDITSKTAAQSITKTAVGGNMKSIVDYVVQEVSTLAANAATKAPAASASLTGVPTAPTASAGTNTTQIATTAFTKSSIDASVGYKVYSAFITQAGTGNAPLVTVLKNNTGATFTWDYFSVGAYAIQASSAVFTANKTFVASLENQSASYPDVNILGYILETNFGVVEVRNAGSYADSILNAFIEIRIYN